MCAITQRESKAEIIKKNFILCAVPYGHPEWLQAAPNILSSCFSETFPWPAFFSLQHITWHVACVCVCCMWFYLWHTNYLTILQFVTPKDRQENQSQIDEASGFFLCVSLSHYLDWYPPWGWTLVGPDVSSLVPERTWGNSPRERQGHGPGVDSGPRTLLSSDVLGPVSSSQQPWKVDIGVPLCRRGNGPERWRAANSPWSWGVKAGHLTSYTSAPLLVLPKPRKWS